MNKTKRPKIEIGTTFPHFWRDRYVNAEVVSRRKDGRRWLWKIRLTESQQPIRRAESETIVEFEKTTKSLADELAFIDSLPCYGPSGKLENTCVVQWIDFGGGGLWCEIREPHKCGGSRNTHWARSEYGTVDRLLASGDARDPLADRVIAARCRAFSSEGIRWYRIAVSSDGTVRVWDAVSKQYSTCHALSASTQARLRRQVRDIEHLASQT